VSQENNKTETTVSPTDLSEAELGQADQTDQTDDTKVEKSPPPKPNIPQGAKVDYTWEGGKKRYYYDGLVMQETKEVKLPRHIKEDTLRFSPYAWAKLVWFRDRGDTEIGGFAVTHHDDPFYVEDFITVKQKASGAFVEFDDEDVNQYLVDQTNAGHEPHHCMRIWLHTHPGNSASPSGTDENCFKEAFGNCNWAVMFILAKGGTVYCRVRFNIGPGCTKECKVVVDYETMPFRGVDIDTVKDWELEYCRNVRVGGKIYLDDFWGEQLYEPTSYTAGAVNGSYRSGLPASRTGPRREMCGYHGGSSYYNWPSAKGSSDDGAARGFAGDDNAGTDGESAGDDKNRSTIIIPNETSFNNQLVPMFDSDDDFCSTNMREAMLSRFADLVSNRLMHIRMFSPTIIGPQPLKRGHNQSEYTVSINRDVPVFGATHTLVKTNVGYYVYRQSARIKTSIHDDVETFFDIADQLPVIFGKMRWDYDAAKNILNNPRTVSVLVVVQEGSNTPVVVTQATYNVNKNRFCFPAESSAKAFKNAPASSNSALTSDKLGFKPE
jgi:hypothetical protein